MPDSGLKNPKRHASPTLAIATVAIIAVSLAALRPALAEQSQCGPYGDPPAVVYRGWLARTAAEHAPLCIGGEIMGPWRDPGGEDRYACRYAPADASRADPLPLVIFLHGSLVTADSVIFTGLTRATRTAKLDPASTGFILLAPEGRITSHYYPAPDDTGFGWDNWYRQFDASGIVNVSAPDYAVNTDAAAIDHFVDEEIATGAVNSNRIYAMGWSNGAAMAILYALNRPHVAAAAVYSAPNPFRAFADPCPQTPIADAPRNISEVRVLNPRAHIMHVRNACDIGGICPNGIAFAQTCRPLGTDLDDVIINSDGEQVQACDSSCGIDPLGGGEIGIGGKFRGAWRHLMWPKAWNERMFAYLRDHPLAH